MQGPRLTARGDRFVVEAPGWLAGRWWRLGEQIVVARGAFVDDLVVLVPEGRGTPRLGHVRRGRLEGDRGEACDERRWRVAGRVRAIEPPAPPSEPQLPLFPGALTA